MSKTPSGRPRTARPAIPQEPAPEASPGAAQEAPPPVLVEPVPVDLIDFDPENPRRFVDDARFKELRRDVRARGIVQNIVVRPHPQIEGRLMLVCGERRLRAAKLEGLASINVSVRALDERQAHTLAMVENLQREDLTPLEEARAYQHQVDDFKKRPEDVAADLGVDVRRVRRRLLLVNLVPKAIELIDRGLISVAGAEELARAPQDVQQKFLERQRDIEQGVPAGQEELTPTWGVAEVRDFVRGAMRMLPLATAFFDTEDPELAGGACSKCPKNTATQRDLFCEKAGPGLCTDERCFAVKTDAYWKRKRRELEERGARVIDGKDSAKHLFFQGRQLAYGSEFVSLDEGCHEEPGFRAALEEQEKYYAQAEQDPNYRPPPDPEPPKLRELIGPYLQQHPEALVLLRADPKEGGPPAVFECIQKERLPELMRAAGREDIAAALAEKKSGLRSPEDAQKYKQELAMRQQEERAIRQAVVTWTGKLGELIEKGVLFNNDETRPDLEHALRELCAQLWRRHRSKAAARRGFGDDGALPILDEKRIKPEPRLAKLAGPQILSFLIELLIEDMTASFMPVRVRRALDHGSLQLGVTVKESMREVRAKQKAKAAARRSTS